MLLGHCPGGAATLAVVASTVAAGLAIRTCHGFLIKLEAHLFVAVQSRR